MKKILEKRTATIRSFELVPILNSESNFVYQYDKKSFAIQRLQDIRRKYIISKENEELEEDNLLLWIKGYEITEKEELEGYLGNFCIVSLVESKEGFSFKAEKIKKPLSNHPQKKRKNNLHPNWGHPILRKIRKQHFFYGESEARLQLNKLLNEYPKSAIPAGNRLYIFVWNREYLEGGSKPFKKFIFEVVEKENGKYIIDYWENPVQAKLIRYKFIEYNFSTFD